MKDNEVQALSKYVRMSPLKVRQVARSIQGMGATQALDLLGVIPRKSARLVAQTLKSAMANAENNHNLSSKDLIVKSAVVNQGPTFGRFRPVGRGAAHPYTKKTSHIHIILSPKIKR